MSLSHFLPEYGNHSMVSAFNIHISMLSWVTNIHEKKTILFQILKLIC